MNKLLKVEMTDLNIFWMESNGDYKKKSIGSGKRLFLDGLLTDAHQYSHFGVR